MQDCRLNTFRLRIKSVSLSLHDLVVEVTIYLLEVKPVLMDCFAKANHGSG